MPPIWTNPRTWWAVVLATLLLSLAMLRHPLPAAHLPADVGHRLGRLPVAVAVDDDRMLLVVSFHRSQQAEADGWVRGLQLHESGLHWARMPVLNDPGDPALRAQAELRLGERYPRERAQGKLLAAFTDRAAFLRALGVTDTGRVQVLVIDRRGEVLARVAGPYDEVKARLLRDDLALRVL